MMDNWPALALWCRMEIIDFLEQFNSHKRQLSFSKQLFSPIQNEKNRINSPQLLCVSYNDGKETRADYNEDRSTARTT